MEKFKTYLVIENKGEIINEALYMLGAGNKRNKTGKIGKYQTGNKYGLAAALREGYDVKVFSGEREIAITTVPFEFDSENKFEKILIDGEGTSITTNFGHDEDWNIMMSLREFKANSMDEGEDSHYISPNIGGVSGQTRFYVEFKKDVVNFYSKIDKYFADNRTPIFTHSMGKIYKSYDGVANIYFNDIWCSEESKPSAFDFSLNEVNIAESRLARNSRELITGYYTMMADVTDHDMILDFVRSSGTRGTYENDNLFSPWDAPDFNIEWYNALKPYVLLSESFSENANNFKEDEVIVVHNRLYDDITKKWKDLSSKTQMRNGDRVAEPVEMKQHYAEKVKMAVDYLAEFNIHVVHPWKPVVFNNNSILGMAFDDQILLSEGLFMLSDEEIIKTVLEEHIHLHYKVNDRSIRMQNILFDIIYNLTKQVKALAA